MNPNKYKNNYRIINQAKENIDAQASRQWQKRNGSRGITIELQEFNLNFQAGSSLEKCSIDNTLKSTKEKAHTLIANFQQCRTNEEIKSLYERKKEKTYFDFIHASTCFSKAIKLLTNKNINDQLAQLKNYIEKVFFEKEINDGILSNISNSAAKLLINKSLKERNLEVEKFGCRILCNVFQKVKQSDLNCYQLQVLLNLSTSAIKFLEYSQKMNLKQEKQIAMDILYLLFKEIKSRGEDLKGLDPQSLSNLSNNAMKLLEYSQRMNFNENKHMAMDILNILFKEITIRSKNLKNLDPQNLLNITHIAVQFFEFARAEFMYEEQKAMEVLFIIFQEIQSRIRFFKNFPTPVLSIITNALVKANPALDQIDDLWIEIGKSLCFRDFNTLTTQDIGNLAWSFSIGKKLPLIYDWLIKGLLSMSESTISQFEVKEFNQIYIALTRKALDDKIWKKNSPDAFLDHYLRGGAHQQFRRKILENVKFDFQYIQISKFQKEVKTCLEILLPQKYWIKEEVYIKPYSVDLGIFDKVDNKLIALVEANGPQHFMLDGEYSLSHKFRENLLQDMGYSEIININFKDWTTNLFQNLVLINEKLAKIIARNNDQQIFVAEPIRIQTKHSLESDTTIFDYKNENDNLQPVEEETDEIFSEKDGYDSFVILKPDDIQLTAFEIQSSFDEASANVETEISEIIDEVNLLDLSKLENTQPQVVTTTNINTKKLKPYKKIKQNKSINDRKARVIKEKLELNSPTKHVDKVKKKQVNERNLSSIATEEESNSTLKNSKVAKIKKFKKPKKIQKTTCKIDWLSFAISSPAIFLYTILFIYACYFDIFNEVIKDCMKQDN